MHKAPTKFNTTNLVYIFLLDVYSDIQIVKHFVYEYILVGQILYEFYVKITIQNVLLK